MLRLSSIIALTQSALAWDLYGPTDDYYYEWQTPCVLDSDCENPNDVCIGYRYANPTINWYGSASACLGIEYCKGNGANSYPQFGSTSFAQAICNDEQKARAEGVPDLAGYDLTPNARPFHTEFNYVCSEDADCRDGSVCREYYWQLQRTEDFVGGTGYATGRFCLPSASLALCNDGREESILINTNYEQRYYSWYFSVSCSSELVYTAPERTLEAAMKAIASELDECEL